MKQYIGVDLGKRKAVAVKKDQLGKVTDKVTLAVTEAARDPESDVNVSSASELHRSGFVPAAV
jgi:hypothetical protein